MRKMSAGPTLSNSPRSIENHRPTRVWSSERRISSRHFRFTRRRSSFSAPNVLTRRTPEMDSVSDSIPVSSAIRSCASRLSALRFFPTRRVGATKSGSKQSETAANRQSSQITVAAAETSTTAFFSTAVSVLETAWPTPSTSLSSRESGSPGRADAKYPSGCRWRCLKSRTRSSKVTRSPISADRYFCRTPRNPAASGPAIISVLSKASWWRSFRGIASSTTPLTSTGGRRFSRAPATSRAKTAAARPACGRRCRAIRRTVEEETSTSRESTLGGFGLRNACPPAEGQARHPGGRAAGADRPDCQPPKLAGAAPGSPPVGEEVAQIGRVGRVTEEGRDLEDVLHGPQERAVRVADRVRIPAPLRVARQSDETDGPVVAALALVEGDEEHAVPLERGRAEDLRHFAGEPGVPVADGVARRAPAAVVHVVAQVRRDEAVGRHGVHFEVARELGVRPDVLDAVAGRIDHVVEVDHRVVLGGVLARGVDRARRTGDVFLVRLPGNARSFQERHQIARGRLVVRARAAVVPDAEVGARFQPEVVRQARVESRRVHVVLRARPERQQRAVDA